MTIAEVLKQRGRTEGRTEGIIEGKRKGLLKGKREGKREGKLEERRQIANKMLAQGLDKKLIYDVTGYQL